MKNLTYLFAAFIMSLIVVSCGGNSNSTEAERLVQLEDSIKALNTRLQSNTSAETQATDLSSSTATANQNNDTEDNTTASSAIGTYEFTDRISTWVLVINSDGTAYIYNKESGENVKAYGSWDKFVYKNYNRISLHFGDKRPNVWFPSGEESLYYPQIYDGYIYKSHSSCEAKNPELRLPISKIK